ncbi:MAG: hypothetical protein JWO06_1535 [Bacteroidota bacterium]|nr:hypothetical protein [Bacteroidota bacterium]
MKQLSLIIGLSFLVNLLFSQIPNSDMENWDNQPVLLDWETNSRPLTTPPYDPYVVKKDTGKYSGNWAADLFANGVFKAYAKTTFAVQQHPNHLSLYYRLTFAPCVNDTNYFQKDTASVLVELLNQGAVVDMGYWESITTQFNYAQLSVPLSQNATIFDSCRITMMGGDISGGCGFAAAPTRFIVDHLELKYSAQNTCIDSAQICDSCLCPQVVDPVCGCNGVTYTNYCYAHSAGVTSWASGACTVTAIEKISSEEMALQVFPVPATNVLNIQYQLIHSGEAEIRVSNMLGKTFTIQREYESAGTQKAEIALDNFAKGVYFIELKNGEERVVRKFVKD